MSEFSLPRTGQPRLKFTGDLLAESDGRMQAGREHSRWHEVAVYRAAGCYVVAIGYRTLWQGELGCDYAESVRTAAEVVSYLRAYRPTVHVRGYPDGEAYARKQERLFADIAHRYYAQVSDVLSGDEFAEDAIDTRKSTA